MIRRTPDKRKPALVMFLNVTHRSVTLTVIHYTGGEALKARHVWNRKAVTPLMIAANAMLSLRDVDLPMNERPSRVDLYVTRMAEVFQLCESGDGVTFSVVVKL